jgi:hypothetical protein
MAFFDREIVSSHPLSVRERKRIVGFNTDCQPPVSDFTPVS